MEALAAPPAGFLDAVGGQPVLPAAARAQALAQGQAWADPTARHHAGRRAGLLLDTARASIAASLTALGRQAVRAEEVWFTASAAAAAQCALDDASVTIGAVETNTLLSLARTRAHRLVPVDALGRVDPTPLREATDLRILQAANAEVGTIQPIASIGEGSLLMDAGQALARIALPDGWSTLFAGARDWGGPSGVAILVARGARRPAPDIRGWLGGPPDIPAAVAAATALEALGPVWRELAARDRARIAAIREAAGAIVDVEVLGDPDDRLPHVVTFSALYASGESIVDALDAQGFAVASGSACLAPEAQPSHVLAAMGAFTGGNVRVSLPFGVTDETVERFIEALPSTIARVRDDVLGAH